VLDDSGALWTLLLESLATDADWTLVERTERLITLAAVNGRLFAIDDQDRLLARPPLEGALWRELGTADGCVILTGHAGTLYGTSPGRPLRRWSPERAVMPVRGPQADRAAA
jgi:hypothetical protein